MSDNLTVFDVDYTNVTGIKVKGTGNGTLTYIRPTGTKSITENGTGIDVAQYASVDVAVEGGPDWPVFTSDDNATTITCDKTYAECRALIANNTVGAFLETPSLSAPFAAIHRDVGVSDDIANVTLRYVYTFNGVPNRQINYASDGTITLQSNADTVAQLSVIANGTYTSGQEMVWNEVTVNVPSGTPTLQSKTATPTTSQQVITADSGYDGLSQVTVSAMPSGNATAPASITGTAASLSTGTNTLTLTKSVSVTPSVTAGYVSSGTAGNSSVSLTASVPTKAAATITPSTTNQTIAAGTYLTGTQTIAGDADLIADNIISTANIFGVQGSVVVQNYYTGSSEPSSSLGQNGDIYLQG